MESESGGRGRRAPTAAPVALAGTGVGPVIVPTALALLLLAVGLQGMAKEMSYDEAYTVLCYAVPGASFSLRHFAVPNNHVLYSMLLAPLAGWHLEPLYRLPSLVASVVTVALAGRCLRGAAEVPPVLRWTVLLAAFAAFPAFLSFGTQIRGYALAGALVAACLALLLPRAPGRGPLGGLLYAAAGATAIGVVATSVLPLAALGLFDVAREGVRNQARWRAAAAAAVKHLAVLAGLLVYAPVWRDVVANTRRGWGDAGWPLAGPVLLAPVVPLGVLVVAALVLGGGRRTAGRVRDISEPALLGLAVAAVVGGVLLAGVRLFPRSFTGFIPLVAVAGVGIALQSLAARPRALLAAALATAVIGQAYWQLSVTCALADGRAGVPRVLLPGQYEARDYDPFEATAAASRYARAGEPVFVDNRDPYCDEMGIYYYAVMAGWERKVVFAPRGIVQPPPQADFAGAVVVSRDAEGRDGIAWALGLKRPLWDVLKGRGHFKVWRLADRPR